MSMTPAELRKLADKAEGIALKHAFEAANQGWSNPRADQAEKANRLFLMARNLRERAVEIALAAAQDAAKFETAQREAARNAVKVNL